MADHRQPNIVATVLLGIVGVALVAVVIGLAGGGDDDDGGVVAAETREVTVTGERLPLFEADGDDAAAGMPAPVVEGETFGGDAITVPGDGPAVIVFLAHWCPHCQREVPVIVEWLEESGAPEGVDLIGVATSIDSTRENYPPSAWLEREGWDVPTLVDDELDPAGAAFGLSAFPFFVVVDADGTIVGRASGELEVTQLEALVEAARG